MISGLSIDSGMTLKTCGLREDVDTIALGLDRRKMAKGSLSSKYFSPDVLVFCQSNQMRSAACHFRRIHTRVCAANLSHLSRVSSACRSAG